MPKIKSCSDKAGELIETEKKNIDIDLKDQFTHNKSCDQSKIDLQSKLSNELKHGTVGLMKNKPDNIQMNSLEPKINRRDFMVLTATSMAGIGVACSLWPLVDSLNPSADVLASSSIEVEIDKIQAGQTAVVSWRGKPVFIKHRTAEEIEKARKVNLTELTDPEEDKSRVKDGHDQWLVVVGICTHLGCIPIDNKGDYDGWFCPCHGSHYDTSGRIRKGPAPKNLEVPQYQFISDKKIRIG